MSRVTQVWVLSGGLKLLDVIWSDHGNQEERNWNWLVVIVDWKRLSGSQDPREKFLFKVLVLLLRSTFCVLHSVFFPYTRSKSERFNRYGCFSPYPSRQLYMAVFIPDSGSRIPESAFGIFLALYKATLTQETQP